jgi:hypothetical protein
MKAEGTKAGVALDLEALQKAQRDLDAAHYALIQKGHAARQKVTEAITDTQRALDGIGRASDIPWKWTVFTSFGGLYDRLREAREVEEKTAWAEAEKVRGFVFAFQELCRGVEQLKRPLDPKALDLKAARLEFAFRERMLDQITAVRRGIEAAGECEATKSFPTAQLEALEVKLKKDLAALEAGKGVRVRTDRPPLDGDRVLDPEAKRLLDTIRDAFRAAAVGDLHPALEKAAQRAFANRNVIAQTKNQLVGTRGFAMFDPAIDCKISDAFEEKGKKLTTKEIAAILLANAPQGLFSEFVVALSGAPRPRPQYDGWQYRTDPYAQRLCGELLRRDRSIEGKTLDGAIDAAFVAGDHQLLGADRLLDVLIDLRKDDPAWRAKVNEAALASYVEPRIEMPGAYLLKRHEIGQLIESKLAPFAEAVMHRIDRARMAAEIDEIVSGAKAECGALEALIAELTLGCREELAFMKGTEGGPKPNEIYVFEMKLNQLKTESDGLLRQAPAMIDRQAATSKAALEALLRSGKPAELSEAANLAQKGVVTADSVAAATREQLAFMVLSEDVRRTIESLRGGGLYGWGLTGKAFERAWAECIVETPDGLAAKKEGGPFTRAALALRQITGSIGMGVSPKSAAEWIEKNLPTALSWLKDEGEKRDLEAWARATMDDLRKNY